MAKYHFTRKAAADLAHIWEYSFETWSEQQADSYYKSLISGCGAVARNPGLGKSYSDIAPNLRGIKVQRHVIFYRVNDKGAVEITRILHERMDLKRRVDE
jgi:toxin ParE1/3/4